LVFLDFHDAVLALEVVALSNFKGEDFFNLAAPETSVRQPVQDLISKNFPDCQMYFNLSDSQPPISNEKFISKYGYCPKYPLNESKLLGFTPTSIRRNYMVLQADGEIMFIKDQVVLERIGNEIIIISFDSGKYFSAKGLATDLLLLIQNFVPIANWESKLIKHYSTEVLSEDKIKNFIKMLLDNNLCIKAELLELTNYELPLDFQRDRHDELIFTIYDDLQDIIIVDPIHDTSVEGWPEKEEK
jgi:hypothetical protein